MCDSKWLNKHCDRLFRCTRSCIGIAVVTCVFAFIVNVACALSHSTHLLLLNGLHQVVDRCALTRMAWSPDGRRLCVGDAKVMTTCSPPRLEIAVGTWYLRCVATAMLNIKS